MRPIQVSQTGVGTTATVPMDIYISAFQVSLALTVSGTVTAKVQHTFDDVFNSAVTPTWFDHPSMTGLTANTDGNYAFPVRAIRLNVTAGTGTGTLTIVQSGISGQ